MKFTFFSFYQPGTFGNDLSQIHCLHHWLYFLLTSCYNKDGERSVSVNRSRGYQAEEGGGVGSRVAVVKQERKKRRRRKNRGNVPVGTKAKRRKSMNMARCQGRTQSANMARIHFELRLLRSGGLWVIWHCYHRSELLIRFQLMSNETKIIWQAAPGTESVALIILLMHEHLCWL